MDARTFLSEILPTEGCYLVAAYNTKKPYLNEEHVVNTIDELIIEGAKLDAKGKDCFFALGSLDKPSIPLQRLNKTTGQLEDYESSRCRQNIRHISTLFLDVDVDTSGTKGTKPCYATKSEALSDIRQFCKDVGMPKPYMVDSGGGVHVYWRIEGNENPEDQNELAAMLKSLVGKMMPKVADTGLITDYARVLRVPGTNNYKLDEPRPVEILLMGTAKPHDFYSTVLTAKCEEHGIKSSREKPQTTPAHILDIGSNIPLKFEEFAPLKFERLLDTCQQIRWMHENQEDVTEPQWLNGIRVLQKCEDFREVIHGFSSKYTKYSIEETDRKIDHCIEKYPTPVGCAQFESHRMGGCSGCIHADKASSPAWLCRELKLADTPVVEVVSNRDGVEVVTAVQMAPCPKPYARTAHGTVVILSQKADGEMDERQICDYDLYPTIRREEIGVQEVTVWRLKIPLREWREVDIPSSVYSNPPELVRLLGAHGAYVFPHQRDLLVNYMIAYLQRSQAMYTSNTLYRKLGWSADKKEFILNKEIITASDIKPSHMTTEISPGVERKGDLNRWVEAMEFLNLPELMDKQFVALAGFGSILMHMTDQAGGTINMDGSSGAGKSSVMLAAASFWGDPKKAFVYGGQGGSTLSGRYQYLDARNNLPAFFDEITGLEGKQARALVHDIAQGVGKERHKLWGGKETWNLIGFTSSNGSLMHKVSGDKADTGGEAARFMELYIPKLDVRTSSEANRFIKAITDNYGLAGPEGARYVIKHYDEVAQRVRAMKELIEKITGDDSADRFKSAMGASGLIGGAILADIGIIKYDMQDLEDMYIERMMESRKVAKSYTMDSIEILANFIGANKSSTLIITGTNGSKSKMAGDVLQEPTNKLLMRHEHDLGLLWIQRQEFQMHCSVLGADHKGLQNDLIKKGILVDPDSRKMLGANTIHGTSASRCWKIDLKNPLLSHATEEDLGF